MNKGIALTIVAVILLGMGLVLFNEYATKPPMPIVAGARHNPVPQAEHETVIPPASTAHETENVTPDPALASSSLESPSTTSASLGALTLDASTTPPHTPEVPSPINPAISPSTPSKSADSAQNNPPLAQEPLPEPLPTPLTAPPHDTEDTTQELQKEAPVAMPIAPPAETATETATEKPQQPDVQAATVLQEHEQAAPLVAKNTEAEKTTAPSEAPELITPTPQPAATDKVIKKVSVLTIGSGVTVRFECTQLPRFSHLRLSSPERIVLDLNGQWDITAPGIPENAFVTNVRIGEQRRGTRIVIDLSQTPKDVRYLKYRETDLDVRIR